MRRLAAIVLALAGCASVDLAPSDVRTRRGPADGREVHRVIALPSTCGTLTFQLGAEDPQQPRAPDPARPELAYTLESLCRDVALVGVDARVRVLLEFRGLSVVDSERVVAETRSRSERAETTSRRSGAAPPDVSETREIHIEGAGFLDATPAMQEAIAAELGADGLLNTRVWIGAPVGIGGRRRVEVQVRLLDLPAQEMVWASRCAVEIGGLETDTQGMERAARCAVEGAFAP